MAQRRPIEDGQDGPYETLERRLIELQATIERQEQRIEELEQRTPAHATPPGGKPPRTPGARHASMSRAETDRRASSRRALLKWGGATAAAATVALVASEGQRARAASANDGDAIIAGQGTTATSTTFLRNNDSTSPNPLLHLDNTWPGGAGNAVQAYCVAGYTALYGHAFGNGGGVYGLSDSGGIGVFGDSGGGGGTGVLGQSSDGYGVKGTSTSGFGVWGSSSSASGVFGASDSGYGVYGQSNSGIGVLGNSTSSVDLYAFGTGRIRQLVQGSAGPPASGTYSKGEQIRDSDGELWLCVLGGSPGSWVMAAHAVFGYSGGATSYLSKPIRLLDTRGGTPMRCRTAEVPFRPVPLSRFWSRASTGRACMSPAPPWAPSAS
ncbi:MAG TPA: hypothetical protein VF120_10965 [Ktedonobacterales bacterium]